MADLPTDRKTDEPPFTKCGVDMFGSFLIKEGRKGLKDMGHYLHAYLLEQSILNALALTKKLVRFDRELAVS